MSVKVYKGMTLDPKTKKTGTSSTGKFWCMFLAKNENDVNSRDSVAVFAQNAEEAQNFSTAKVGNLVDVTKSQRRREDGSWETRVSITAHIDGVNQTAVRDREAYRSFAEQVQGTEQPTKDDYMDFTKAADFSGDDLPFN